MKTLDLLKLREEDFIKGFFLTGDEKDGLFIRHDGNGRLIYKCSFKNFKKHGYEVKKWSAFYNGSYKEINKFDEGGAVFNATFTVPLSYTKEDVNASMTLFNINVYSNKKMSKSYFFDENKKFVKLVMGGDFGVDLTVSSILDDDSIKIIEEEDKIIQEATKDGCLEFSRGIFQGIF